MRDLRGRTALLTGGSSGLGPYIARRLRAEGVRLVLSARRQEELERLAAELGESRVIVADLASSGEAERLAAESGDVDILVANAGVPASGRLESFEVPHIDNAIDVNLRAPIVLARLLVPAMVRRGSGHVLFVASMAGKVPGPRMSVYNATKFGLRGFGHALRSELHGTGVGVSLVSPIYVSEAGMWAATGQRSKMGEVTPGEVADAVLKAIRGDRSEVTVAPLLAKLGSRVLMAAPELVHRIARGAGALPEAAVERQLDKR